MSLTSNVSYPPSHSRMHPQPPYPHSYHPDISPTMSHESLPGNHSSSPVSPQIESSHLYSSSHYHQHHHSHPHQHQQEYQHPPHQTPYHHAPYQAPSPPYSSSTSHPHRSNSAELAQKPTLPYPSSRHPQHTYSSPSHRAHPYSPPTLPPLSGRPPLSPQSPVDSSTHYPIPSSNVDERQHHYRASSSMSASPPPSSSQPTATATSPLLPALSANDRRERNKAASAKYRAKKHYQSGEMRSQITILQDHNNVLTRQLEECRAENASLKNLVEKLKGRLVAEKVLKRLREVGREKNKRRGSGSSSSSNSSSGNPSAGHLAAVSADDLAMLSDSDTDDVVDAASVDLDDLEDVIHEEEEEEEEKKVKGTERRPNDKKLNARRRARTNIDDKEYRDD